MKKTQQNALRDLMLAARWQRHPAVKCGRVEKQKLLKLVYFHSKELTSCHYKFESFLDRDRDSVGSYRVMCRS